MKSLFQRISVVAVFMAYFTLGFSAGKPFPGDTVSRFIAAYGKDSLRTLLDERIKLASDFIYIHTGDIVSPNAAMEFRLYARHFNLPIAEVPLLSAPYDAYFYRLYGQYLGDTIAMFENFKKIKEEKQDVLKLFIENMVHEAGRIGFAVFCNHFTIPEKAVDSLYVFRKRIKGMDKIQTYWSLIELGKNCKDAHPGLEQMQANYFSELVKEYNFSQMHTPAAVLTAKNIESYNLLYPLRTMAYGLYANNGSVTPVDSRLMYLLSSQNLSDGGWPVYYELNKEGDAMTTLYGLWALCEWRELLNGEK